MKLLLPIILLIVMVSLSACQKDIENPMENIERKKIHSLSLHLYPSTIRMVNIANDPNFYEVTKNVKKAHYLQISLDTPEKAAAFADWQKEQDLSGWHELLSARMNGTMVKVYSPESKDDVMFATLKSDDRVNLVWIDGKVDLAKATKLIETGIDLGPVTDYLSDKKETEERREKMKSLRKQMEEEDSVTKIQPEK